MNGAASAERHFLRLRDAIGLMLILGCRTQAVPPIEREAHSLDGSRVQLALSFPAPSCPFGVPSPCYRYHIRFTPVVDFDTGYVVPALPPNPFLSPLPAPTVWAHLTDRLQRAREQAVPITLDGVNRYLDSVSQGGFPSLCALRVALDPPAYGRISLHFVDEQGHSRYRRDPTDTLEQFFMPGLADPVDSVYRADSSWVWIGHFGAEALPLAALRDTLRLQVVLLSACRPATLQMTAG